MLTHVFWCADVVLLSRQDGGVGVHVRACVCGCCWEGCVRGGEAGRQAGKPDDVTQYIRYSKRGAPCWAAPGRTTTCTEGCLPTCLPASLPPTQLARTHGHVHGCAQAMPCPKTRRPGNGTTPGLLNRVPARAATPTTHCRTWLPLPPARLPADERSGLPSPPLLPPKGPPSRGRDRSRSPARGGDHRHRR